MKVALVTHGYPPELVGGTELAVQALAHGLAQRGVEVLVIAGSMDHAEGFRLSRATDQDPREGTRVEVVRIHRADLFFDHWQKSASGSVARAFGQILEQERPDLVHVHHWIRLSDDLVARAAEAGVPACVTLHDLWTSCLVAFRVRPASSEFCRAPLAPDPCLACAEGQPPRTPWMPREMAQERLALRKRALASELGLARAVIVPTRAHGQALATFLGFDPERTALRVLPHGRDLQLVANQPLLEPAQHGRLELAAWGHLHPLKGQDLLLEALRTLPDPGAVRLHLLGGEPDAGFARRLRREAQGLEVRFHGPFAVDELDRHPGTRVHAMVSGSRAHESWGLVLDEAVALGLPMVLPASGAFPERMTRGALFFQPGDPEDLGRRLSRLLQEGVWRRLVDELPALGEVAPSVAEHTERIQGVYAEVLEAGAPAVPEDLVSSTELDARVAAWDAALSRTPAPELGFPPADADSPGSPASPQLED